MKTQITKRVAFDAGHRIPSHASKCRHVHGHRWTLDATVEGPVMEVRGKTDDGMVLDYGVLKAILETEIVNKWDHAFIACKDDLDVVYALKILGPEHRTVLLDVIPTSENLAREAFNLIQKKLDDFNGFKPEEQRMVLVRVRLYETPSSWADYTIHHATLEKKGTKAARGTGVK